MPGPPTIATFGSSKSGITAEAQSSLTTQSSSVNAIISPVVEVIPRLRASEMLRFGATRTRTRLSPVIDGIEIAVFDTTTISLMSSTLRRDEMVSPRECLMPRVGTTTDILALNSHLAFHV
jgi:hypothetical protein